MATTAVHMLLETNEFPHVKVQGSGITVRF